jgi:trehalose/maltose hydrolase-like predicted phosphorylase
MPALAFIDPTVLQDLATYRASAIRPAPLAPFPWESSVTGKETAPGESIKEIHISGSVLWGFEFEKALGATIPAGIQKRVADYYTQRATKRPDGKLGLLGVMSPDESHIGANDLYTNLLAQWAINGATWRPVAKPAATMYLPTDPTSFLTYDNDMFRGYKQAAAVLSIYPLQYPPAEAEAKVMLERFQDKVIPNGPAMSDSIHATIWARLNEPDKAYALWKKSWGEFVKGPFLLFSEKRSTPTTYFTTGAAGCLQTVIYGFLGFRVDEQPEPGAAWKLQLKNGRWLSIKPHLPAAWKSATFRHFHVLGRTYTLTVKREGSKTVTSIQQGV